MFPFEVETSTLRVAIFDSSISIQMLICFRQKKGWLHRKNSKQDFQFSELEVDKKHPLNDYFPAIGECVEFDILELPNGESKAVNITFPNVRKNYYKDSYITPGVI